VGESVPFDSVLGADEVLEAGFAIRDGHLKGRWDECSADALEKSEGYIWLSVVESESFS
jgi:hypothetical protein